MFDSLDEQIKHDDLKGTTNQQRILHWAMIGLIAVVAIGGLFWGISIMH